MKHGCGAIVCVLALVMVCLATGPAAASEGKSAENRVDLGKLATGAQVSFIRNAAGEWGIEVNDVQKLRFLQPQPVRVEVYTETDEVRQFACGYKSLEGLTTGISGTTQITYGADIVFLVEDRWSITGSVLLVHRKLRVSGSRRDGFLSAVMLSTTPETTWPDLDYLAPGLLYGNPAYDGNTSPGGLLNYQAKRFWMREDFLPAPLFAMAFRDGTSITVLDSAPKGDTTLRETRADAGEILIDERFSFGAVGANEAPNGGVEIGFWLPGSTPAYAERSARTQSPSWRRRYHPIKDRFVQEYDVAFRFGQNESFPQLMHNSWRWAWQALKPAVNYQDIELVRRTLIDHLSERVMTVEGRTGIPLVVSTRTGKVWPDADSNSGDEARWWRAVLGYVGKNIEAADQLLREADRDSGARGQKMRQQGLDIIDTFVRLVPMSPPAGTGFNLLTGKISMTNPQSNTWHLRAPAEDMRMLMEAYRREKKAGRDHPQWLKWCCDFADWALTKQRPDGSFPCSFRPGTGEVVEESGAASYSVVPLFLVLSEDTGDPKYRDAAARAAEYVWQNFGTRGIFLGGAIDYPNIVDKEAGLLSMEAFLCLYETTKEAKWLTRAQVAGDFTESWMWIWNVPMPVDANDVELLWKRGVPTVGVQGITAQTAGDVDQYLDWSTQAYAKLYKYTKDPHYLDVARILLHNCKAMLALPGRTYGMLGPGWQQESWRMGPGREGRGFGTPEKWMPWVSTNHLYSITGLEQFDPNLFRQLTAKPAASGSGS